MSQNGVTGLRMGYGHHTRLTRPMENTPFQGTRSRTLYESLRQSGRGLRVWGWKTLGRVGWELPAGETGAEPSWAARGALEAPPACCQLHALSCTQLRARQAWLQGGQGRACAQSAPGQLLRGAAVGRAGRACNTRSRAPEIALKASIKFLTMDPVALPTSVVGEPGACVSGSVWGEAVRVAIVCLRRARADACGCACAFAHARARGQRAGGRSWRPAATALSLAGPRGAPSGLAGR